MGWRARRGWAQGLARPWLWVPQLVGRALGDSRSPARASSHARRIPHPILPCRDAEEAVPAGEAARQRQLHIPAGGGTSSRWRAAAARQGTVCRASRRRPPHAACRVSLSPIHPPAHPLTCPPTRQGSHVMRFGAMEVSEEAAAEFMGAGNTGGWRLGGGGRSCGCKGTGPLLHAVTDLPARPARCTIGPPTIAAHPCSAHPTAQARCIPPPTAAAPPWRATTARMCLSGTPTCCTSLTSMWALQRGAPRRPRCASCRLRCAGLGPGLGRGGSWAAGDRGCR